MVGILPSLITIILHRDEASKVCPKIYAQQLKLTLLTFLDTKELSNSICHRARGNFLCGMPFWWFGTVLINHSLTKPLRMASTTAGQSSNLFVSFQNRPAISGLNGSIRFLVNPFHYEGVCGGHRLKGSDNQAYTLQGAQREARNKRKNKGLH